jgi:hypothetical protein
MPEDLPTTVLLELRVLLQCIRDLFSSEMLHNVFWLLFTDVLGQNIGPMFKAQVCLDSVNPSNRRFQSNAIW